ncbi:MAG TPA: DUF5317 domain-containing protein [Candidatus Bathyarchaeia archaeon]|nr:DUF5317 domain-containing protein [Candidatus Bathyarchaeia archaeon]
MFLDILAISFIIAFLRGGRLHTIPKFHMIVFLVASILLQVGSAFLPAWGNIFVSVAYLCMFLFFFFNREHEDIRVFMIGWFLNATVIWANKGKMPIDLEQASKLPYSLEPIINGEDFKHVILTDDTLLPFLADIIYMPFPMARVISLGDIFIMLGAFLLVQRLMNKPISLLELREGKKYATKN